MDILDNKKSHEQTNIYEQQFIPVLNHDHYEKALRKKNAARNKNSSSIITSIQTPPRFEIGLKRCPKF